MASQKAIVNVYDGLGPDKYEKNTSRMACRLAHKKPGAMRPVLWQGDVLHISLATLNVSSL
jgi:hypothetical protein